MSSELAGLIAADSAFDSKPTADLMHLAAQPDRVADRTRALFALSRRVDGDAVLLTAYLGILKRDDADRRVVGLMTVRLFGIVGLLLNGGAGPVEAGLGLWGLLSDGERQDVRDALRGNDVEFSW